MGIPGIRVEQNRVKLSDQIPLRTPYSVTIVPSSYCNFMCQFCPARIMDKKSIMTFKMFKGIINGAGFKDPVKMLHLYNVGEPTMNANLPMMIWYAKKRKFSERISMVTNASLLDEKMSRELISVYGLDDESYLRNTNRKASFKLIHHNIQFFNSIKGSCQVYIKAIDRVGSRERFIELFKDHCDFYSMEPVLPIWPNFKPEEGGTDKGLYEGIEAKNRLVCYYPFYSMVVNARGFVNPCLADWNETVELGDTEKKGLREIWESEEYQEFRKLQLMELRPDHRLCGSCGTLKVATDPRDDLDKDRERLLDKLYRDDCYFGEDE